jgi:HEAT repeat protein
MSESAAETAARVFETRRIEEATNGTIARACEDVADLFADDDSRIRAAAAIAEGIAGDVSTEAARRLVVNALRSPEFKGFLRPAVAPGSMEDVKRRLEAREAASTKALAGAYSPTAAAPRSLEEIGERMRSLRGLRDLGKAGGGAK